MQKGSADFQPVAQKQRISTIDILRGVAVLGILLMNIPLFAIYLRGDFMDKLLADPGSLNFKVYMVVTALFEGKMRALFCLLFGAGILLFVSQKQASGHKGVTGLFYGRMLWLVIFGLLHAHVLLWEGDILYFYGMFGMLVYLMRNMKPGWMVIGVPLVAILGFVFNVMFYQGIRDKRLAYRDAVTAREAGKALTDTQQKALTEWRQVEIDFIPNAADGEKSVAKMKGTYATVGEEVRKHAWEGETKFLPMLLGDNVALMLLGMALLKWGFLTGKWSNRQYRLTMLIGYGIGLPVVIYSLWSGYKETPNLAAWLAHMEVTPIEWKGLLYPVQRIALVMAHCSLLILLIKGGYLQGLFARLKAVGQMAFSNYILQTVICTLFFFGYGLNFYNELQLWQVMLVAVAIWIIQLIISPIWLKYYRFGPLEWLWRSLTYRQWQPMKRAGVAETGAHTAKGMAALAPE